MLAHIFIDEPIVLESDSRPEDGDDNLDNTHALLGEQLGHDVLDLDILPAPFNRSADKLEDGYNNDGDNDINNNTSLCPPKWQRSASPRCGPNLHHTSTSPPPGWSSGTLRSCSGSLEGIEDWREAGTELATEEASSLGSKSSSVWYGCPWGQG